MKTTITIIVTLLTAFIIPSSHVNAQEGAKVGFSIRPVTMVSYSYTGLSGKYNSAITEVKYRNGFQAGFGVAISKKDNFSLQPEFYVGNQGAKLKSQLELTNPTGGKYIETKSQETSITSLNLPITAKYKLFKGFYLELGAQVGMVIMANQKLESTNNINDPTLNGSAEIDLMEDGSYLWRGQQTTYTKGINPIEASINSGFSYFFNDHMSVRMKYNIGLTDLKASDILTLNAPSDNIKSSIISIGFGYFFGKPK